MLRELAALCPALKYPWKASRIPGTIDLKLMQCMGRHIIKVMELDMARMAKGMMFNITMFGMMFNISSGQCIDFDRQHAATWQFFCHKRNNNCMVKSG